MLKKCDEKIKIEMSEIYISKNRSSTKNVTHMILDFFRMYNFCYTWQHIVRFGGYVGISQNLNRNLMRYKKQRHNNESHCYSTFREFVTKEVGCN